MWLRPQSTLSRLVWIRIQTSKNPLYEYVTVSTPFEKGWEGLTNLVHSIRLWVWIRISNPLNLAKTKLARAAVWAAGPGMFTYTQAPVGPHTGGLMAHYRAQLTVEPLLNTASTKLLKHSLLRADRKVSASFWKWSVSLHSGKCFQFIKAAYVNKNIF